MKLTLVLGLILDAIKLFPLPHFSPYASRPTGPESNLSSTGVSLSCTIPSRSNAVTEFYVDEGAMPLTVEVAISNPIISLDEKTVQAVLLDLIGQYADEPQDRPIPMGQNFMWSREELQISLMSMRHPGHQPELLFGDAGLVLKTLQAYIINCHVFTGALSLKVLWKDELLAWGTIGLFSDTSAAVIDTQAASKLSNATAEADKVSSLPANKPAGITRRSPRLQKRCGPTATTAPTLNIPHGFDVPFTHLHFSVTLYAGRIWEPKIVQAIKHIQAQFSHRVAAEYIIGYTRSWNDECYIEMRSSRVQTGWPALINGDAILVWAMVARYMDDWRVPNEMDFYCYYDETFVATGFVRALRSGSPGVGAGVNGTGVSGTAAATAATKNASSVSVEQ